MGTIRQGIFTDEQVAGLIEKLNFLPRDVFDTKDTVARLEHLQYINNDCKTAEGIVQGIEDEEAFIVRNEKVDGKPKHSNDALRTNALKKVLAEKPEYAEAQRRVMEEKTKQSERMFEIAKAKNLMLHHVDTFKAAIAAAGLIQGLCVEEQTTMDIERAKELESKARSLGRIIDIVANADTKETK